MQEVVLSEVFKLNDKVSKKKLGNNYSFLQEKDSRKRKMDSSKRKIDSNHLLLPRLDMKIEI